MPISCSVQTTSSVATLPVAPGAKGHPPRPAKEASYTVTPGDFVTPTGGGTRERHLRHFDNRIELDGRMEGFNHFSAAAPDRLMLIVSAWA